MPISNQPKERDLNFLEKNRLLAAEEALLEELDDIYLCQIANERRNGEIIPVKIEDL